jgi:ClpP class serine protease
MSPDSVFISFLSISLASVFLALLIGTRGDQIRKVAMAMTEESGGLTRRKASRIAAVERKTAIADEAIQARERGERFVPPRDYRAG